MMTENEAIKILQNRMPGCESKDVFPESEVYEAYDMAIAALKRQRPVKPIESYSDLYGIYKNYTCPVCGNMFKHKVYFCSICGQTFEFEED